MVKLGCNQITNSLNLEEQDLSIRLLGEYQSHLLVSSKGNGNTSFVKSQDSLNFAKNIYFLYLAIYPPSLVIIFYYVIMNNNNI